MNRNSFYILSSCFAAVMLLKANAAWSDTAKVKTEVTSDTLPKTSDISKSTDSAIEPTQCLTGVVAQTIQDDKLALQKQAVEIAKREEVLKALEVRVKTDIQSLEKTNAVMKAELEKLQGIATGDLAHLVSMYETMKPKKAAEIFSKMDPKFSAGFIRQIKPTTAGLILAEMDSKASYQVSLIIANQNVKWRESKSVK